MLVPTVHVITGRSYLLFYIDLLGLYSIHQYLFSFPKSYSLRAVRFVSWTLVWWHKKIQTDVTTPFNDLYEIIRNTEMMCDIQSTWSTRYFQVYLVLCGTVFIRSNPVLTPFSLLIDHNGWVLSSYNDYFHDESCPRLTSHGVIWWSFIKTNRMSNKTDFR